MLESHSHMQQAETGGSGWLDKYIKEYQRDPDYVAERLALRLVEQAIGIMTEKGLSRSDLASLIGVSRAYVTRLFRAPPNLTLRSVAQLAIALDTKPEVSLSLRPVAIKGESVAATVEDWQSVNTSFAPSIRAVAGVGQAVPHADEMSMPYEVWEMRDVSKREQLEPCPIANAA